MLKTKTEKCFSCAGDGEIFTIMNDEPVARPCPACNSQLGYIPQDVRDFCSFSF